MSAPPPPTGPPAGWYPDPEGGSGFRWWDGSAWTETAAAPFAPGPTEPTRPDAGPIGPVDRLVSETFRLASARAGHLLPFVVLFVVTVGLASSVTLWLGVRDTAIVFDEDLATVEVDYGGSAGALTTYLLLVPVSFLGAALVRVATARQVWLAQAGRVEPWSSTLGVVARRWRPVVGGTVARWAVYALIGGGFLVLVAVVPLLILAAPIVLVALVFAWFRLSFVDQAAMLGPDPARPLPTSAQTSRQQSGKLFVRLVVLAIVGLTLFLAGSLVGSFVMSALGDNASAFDPDARVYELNGAVGENIAVFALGGVFGSLALGASTILTAAGTTLLYRNLDGPTDPELATAGEVPAEAPAEPSPTGQDDRQGWR